MKRICSICGQYVDFVDDIYKLPLLRNVRGEAFYGSLFEESHDPRACVCPACHGDDKDRLLLSFIDELKPQDGDKISFLLLGEISEIVRTCLLASPDITNVCYFDPDHGWEDFSNKSFDVIISTKYLERVQDDKKILLEMKRVLRDDGIIIFMPTIIMGICDTVECGPDSTIEDRDYYFGEESCWRIYSRGNFLDRVLEAGLKVYELDEEYFGRETYIRAGLKETAVLYVVAKTDIGLPAEQQYQSQDDLPLVSVIMLTYNRAYCIKQAILSVIRQSYKNYELIVVDDGSKDNTEKEVRSINDARIRYIKHEKNRGANAARNTGICSSNGDYIAFIDSDVIWYPEKLSEQIRCIKTVSRRYAMVYCDVAVVQDNKIVRMTPDQYYVRQDLSGNVFEFMLGHMFIDLPAVLLKRSVLQEVGMFEESLRRLQDWGFFLRIAKKYLVLEMPDVLAASYISEKSISSNAEGFIDTVNYVAELYDMKRKYPRDYDYLIQAGRKLLECE